MGIPFQWIISVSVGVIGIALSVWALIERGRTKREQKKLNLQQCYRLGSSVTGYVCVGENSPQKKELEGIFKREFMNINRNLNLQIPFEDLTTAPNKSLKLKDVSERCEHMIDLRFGSDGVKAYQLGQAIASAMNGVNVYLSDSDDKSLELIRLAMQRVLRRLADLNVSSSRSKRLRSQWQSIDKMHPASAGLLKLRTILLELARELVDDF